MADLKVSDSAEYDEHLNGRRRAAGHTRTGASLARSDCGPGDRRVVRGVASRSYGRTPLGAASPHGATANPYDAPPPGREAPPGPRVRLSNEQRDHHPGGRCSGTVDPCAAVTSGNAYGTSRIGVCHLGDEPAGVRVVVLAPRCRRAAWPGTGASPYRRRVSVSADDLASTSRRRTRRCVVAQFHRLSVPGVQHEHRLLAN